MQLSRITCYSSRPLANSLTSSPSPQSSPASPVSPRLARSPHFARLPQPRPPSSLCSVHSPTIPRLVSPRLVASFVSPRLASLASPPSPPPRFAHRLASHLLLAHAFLTVDLEHKGGENSADPIFKNEITFEPSIGKIQTQRQSIGGSAPDRLAPFSYFSDAWFKSYPIMKYGICGIFTPL